MAKRRLIGLWLAAGTLFVMQAGGPAHGGVVVTGPSQGAIPADDRAPGFLLARGDTAAGRSQGGGGGGGAADDAARSPSPAASPQGGGGGGGQRPSNVIPVMPGNPNGIDAVPEPSPSPSPNDGGGGGGLPADGSPFIRVLPGGDAADWTRSPSPGPR
jgi:hypothetical protein